MYISITTILSNWRTYSFIATMENVFISSFFVRLDSMTLLLSHYMYTTYRTQSVSKMRYYIQKSHDMLWVTQTWYCCLKKTEVKNDKSFLLGFVGFLDWNIFTTLVNIFLPKFVDSLGYLKEKVGHFPIR